MRCWRLIKSDFVKNAFTGDGARAAGGRWNPKGSPVVYTASSLALAALEHLVHADDDLLPADLLSFVVDIPEEVSIDQIVIDHLPPDWRSYPPPEALQDLGAAWLTQRSTAVLCVPSAVIPEEHNFLLNPLHPHFVRITWENPHPFSLDSRLRR